MNGATKALLAASLTLIPCGFIATPTGDPLVMILVGTAGAALTYFLLWWLLTRRASMSWTSGQQWILSGVIGACVILTMYMLVRLPPVWFSARLYTVMRAAEGGLL